MSVMLQCGGSVGCVDSWCRLYRAIKGALMFFTGAF